jgi:predicted metal-dependent phosphoesterase TrpH
MQWRTMDLHLHTPASSDYQQPEVTFLDLLQRAEARGLDIIAFTDHNTVAGYRRMREEIQQLELLEKLNRLLPDEEATLREYRRLLDRILVLPGIEFSATFGFHILAIFDP